MKKITLSLITVACALALTACSNGSKSGVDSYLNSKASEELKEAHKKAEDAQKAQQAAENKAKETEAAKLAAEQKVATLQAEKEAAEQSSTTSKAKLDELQKQLEEALKAQEIAEKNAEEAKKALEAKISAEKLADIKRVENNTSELKKGFENQATEEVSRTEIDAWSGLSITRKSNFSYVNGKVLAIEGQTLVDKPIIKEHKDLNQLIVDGKTITLFSKEEITNRRDQDTPSEQHNIKSLTNSDLAEGTNSTVTGKVGSLPKGRFGSTFEQMRYGYVTVDGKTSLFVQGHLTPESGSENSRYSHYYYGTERGTEGTTLRKLPSTGVFEYVGSAFYGKDGTYEQLSSKAIADFANKKVKVTLSDATSEKAVFGGNISGNTFAGTYNDITTKGAFYGSEAQDIGGMFYRTAGSDKDVHGVFGATKEGCTWRGCPELDANTLNDFTATE
ncbi:MULTISPECIES: transferrin-binding protein-like solute binding protein [Glaesserella]|uniref:Transferrin-binding protein B C-lobe/N-lobe beta-barrel domain-containing protein n=1 Tax=Glaesserella australis TaxID=2094024 RepID=A0A328BZX4_9PAST|nr:MULTISPECIES: transferrin-binding protein-like solute binding protein [Glaesserella]AUI66857.1 hypothetical protein CJD39_09835 [Glaesserella sp. 15-184]RAL19908.1 hypothetical protein C5N92_00605 [Glaesserella australis]